MKTHLLKLAFPVLIVMVAGCSSEEPTAPAASDSSPTPSPQVQSVSVGEPPPGQAPAPPGSVAAPPPASSAIDLSQTARPKNAQGDPMSDLELLNHLVAQLNESRVNPTETPQKAFKTEAEQLAYEEAQQKKQGPVRDINELVSAGVLKALPQAPAGQRYTIDAASGKVVLQ